MESGIADPIRRAVMGGLVTALFASVVEEAMGQEAGGARKKNRAPAPSSADEAAIRAFPMQMTDAWNKGNAEDFAAPFGEDADFIAFEGTLLKGRKAIAAFHQQVFKAAVQGTRLEGEVKFVDFLTPQFAVMHAIAHVTLQGQTTASPSRDSMQLFVAMKRDGVWRIEAMLNARKLTLERQLFLDDLDALPAESQRQVNDLVARLKQ